MGICTYNLSCFQQQVAQLYTQFCAAQDQLLPKKRFSFKARPGKATAPKPTVNPSLALAREEGGSAPAVPLGDTGQQLTRFSGKEKQLIAPTVSSPVLMTICHCLLI